jgi:hypothetical protein
MGQTHCKYKINGASTPTASFLFLRGHMGQTHCKYKINELTNQILFLRGDNIEKLLKIKEKCTKYPALCFQ